MITEEKLIGVLVLLNSATIILYGGYWLNSRPRKANRKTLRNTLNTNIDLAVSSLLQNKNIWESETATDTIDDVKSGFHRATLVKHRCQIFKKHVDSTLLNQGGFVPKSFLTSEPLRVNFCLNCKVGSSTIRTMLYKIMHPFDHRVDLHIVKTHSVRVYTNPLYIKNITLLNSNYINVTFVREPLERLLSAYLDGKGPDSGKRTFKEFLERIIDKGHVQANRHLQSYTLRCKVCDITYQFIGYQSTFDADVKDLLKYQSISYRQVQSKPRHLSHSSDKLKTYFNMIPNDMIRELWRLYFIDYFIFGIPFPEHLLHEDFNKE